MNLDRKLETIKEPCYSNTDEFMYNIGKLLGVFEIVKKLRDDSFIVAYNESDNWYDFVFLEWESESDEGVFYKELCRVSGPGGKDSSLRECRHTYFADNGYIFYMKKENIRAMLDFLEEYYDLD